MKTGDVFVRRARISVRASDGSVGVSALHVVEAQLPSVLADLGRSIGDEFIALRSVAVHVRAWVEGRHASPISLERSIRAALATRVEEARRSCPRGGALQDVAWFPTEAAAIAGYLGTLANPSSADWAFSVFQPLGSNWLGVFESCAERGRELAGDVLAEALERWGEDALVREVQDARTLCNIWTAASGQVLEQLPRTLESTWSDAMPASSSDDQATLVALARLFVRWPPARALAISPALLATLASRPGSRPSADAIESGAGGLVVWAELLSQSELGREIATAYPDARARAAVLWALGRALEDPSLNSRDPLLLLFCGEEPGRAVFPDFTLREIDSEPLHALGFRAFAREHGLATVRVTPFGDGVIAVADPGIVIDWSPTSSMHDAISSIAERFIRWTGAAPRSIEVCDTISPEDLELVHVVDVPALPDEWRAAVMSVASVAMMLLRHQWRASPHDCRAWRANLTAEAVVLRSRDVRRVANGAWLKPASVRMGERVVIVSIE